MKIFVQIAAYRDPELLPTIIDCLAKAKYPRDLVFGVCWQTGESDHCLDHLKALKNFRIDKVPWRKSHGLGWARSRVQSLYEGEEFTLQLHSHHRFALHWDEILIQSMEATGSVKPAISTYTAAYDPYTNRKATEPCIIAADRFAECGNLLLRPEPLSQPQDQTTPLRARFASGHFLFTLGQHCEDCRYDSQLYFTGDDISLTVRSFTHGYDLFHPQRTIVWHEYVRKGRLRHWDDHTSARLDKGEKTWQEWDAIGRKRLRKLLHMEINDENLGSYGLGTVRELRDYESYAGVDFRHRRLDPDAIAGVAPAANGAGKQSESPSGTTESLSERRETAAMLS